MSDYISAASTAASAYAPQINQYTALASTLAKGVGEYKQGKISEAKYGTQAALTRLQGRTQALRYAQQGNGVLRRSLEAQAMARARAAAGGVNPLSGSAQFIQTASARDAADDLGILGDNGLLALANAASQAGIFETAGRDARRSGLLAGLTTAGGGVADYLKLGSKPAGAKASIYDTGANLKPGGGLGLRSGGGQGLRYG